MGRGATKRRTTCLIFRLCGGRIVPFVSGMLFEMGKGSDRAGLHQEPARQPVTLATKKVSLFIRALDRGSQALRARHVNLSKRINKASRLKGADFHWAARFARQSFLHHFDGGQSGVGLRGHTGMSKLSACL